jgi:hypothetical protein
MHFNRHVTEFIYIVSNCIFHLFSPVVEDLPSAIRGILHKTIFTDIKSITEEDMVGILFGIYKDVYVTEHEFYELKDQNNSWFTRWMQTIYTSMHWLVFLIIHVSVFLLPTVLYMCCYIFGES